MANDDIKFPDGFLWGAGSAAYQIEGAHQEGERGVSIWDRFSHTSGNIADLANGDTACDHYHHVKEDVALMKEMGLQAYRFSIAWPRILPSGTQPINPRGLDFYERLVDDLLEADIVPFVTLYHWDLPQNLEDDGGWANRATCEHFADFTRAVADRLGDRVIHWITINEPWCAAMFGYLFGRHAPGLRDLTKALQASHHLLLAHGKAVQVLRDVAPDDAEIGITLNMKHCDPDTEALEDEAANARQDGFINRWFLDPIVWGSYPKDMLEWFAMQSHRQEEGDLDIISSPVDFIGLTYFTRSIVRYAADAVPIQAVTVKERGARHTALNWAVYPGGLYKVLMRLHQEYRIPRMYITGNGAVFHDDLVEGGMIQDYDRLGYLKDHLSVCARAIRDGVNLAGYFVWSLMDGFEWSHGFSKPFGLVHVDHETGKRTPKLSTSWYADVIKTNSLSA